MADRPCGIPTCGRRDLRRAPSCRIVFRRTRRLRCRNRRRRERAERSGDKWPSAIFILQLSRENHSHSGMLSSIAELSCVRSVQELVQ